MPALGAFVLAMVLVACGSGASAPGAREDAVHAASTTTREPADASAAFVIYTADTTTVVTIAGMVTTARGVWVLDEQHTSGPSIVFTTLQAPPESVLCACERPDACSGALTTRLDVEGGVLSLSATGPACPCFRRTDDGTVPVSIAGDALYRLGSVLTIQAEPPAPLATTWQTGSRVALADAAVSPDETGSGECFLGPLEAPGDPRDLLREHCPDRITPVGSVPSAVYVRRGQRLDVTSRQPGRQPLVIVAARALTRESCPGPSDPCGDPAPFADITTSAEWWVATSGRAALVVRDGATWVWPAGAPRLAVDASLDPNTWIGVRYHADVTPLVRAMQAGPPTDAALAAHVDTSTTACTPAAEGSSSSARPRRGHPGE